MDTSNSNQMQQPMQNMSPAPKKKGHGGMVVVIIILLVLLAVLFFWPKESNTTTPPTAQEQQVEDLGTIEAELDATVFEGVSEGL